MNRKLKIMLFHIKNGWNEKRGRPIKQHGYESAVWIILATAVVSFLTLIGQDYVKVQPVLARETIRIDSFKVMKLSVQNKEKDSEIESISMAAKIATASSTAHTLTKDQAKEMIATMFPVQFRDRFAKITMECENGKLNSAATHINKDGTEDVGMAQINNKWHQKRVQTMFGMDFDVAMKIPLLNYIYAAYLVDHDQNFHQWSCDQILK